MKSDAIHMVSRVYVAEAECDESMKDCLAKGSPLTVRRRNGQVS